LRSLHLLVLLPVLSSISIPLSGSFFS
jgi:hypothetical protein